MKKPSSKIKAEIAKLTEQLQQAETREAERIGRIALKAGLGEIEIEETALRAAFEEMAGRFRDGDDKTSGRKGNVGRKGEAAGTTPIGAGAAASGNSEA
ncbi:TraC family protein (plasmid) [Mesorhizobium sp. NBSH29]|uniref:conjugal transfer protein TraC n=1 Tax=Mesorhizobium sp. NBSH29 TaxID=2654249 RepID=UPI00189662AE|nr:conjugal transfer protein TraC [Mesorhizobium sp. NBSH29]QPC88968.1 TraC family protein [Mesorhizobium sp. NBSH29]